MPQLTQALVRQYISTLELPSRTSCPICYRKNTFTATVLDGFVVYHCYSASCSIKGRYRHEFSLTDVRNYSSSNLPTLPIIKRPITPTTNSTSLDTFIIPDYWTNPLQNERCLNFIKYWKLFDLYINKEISLYYDPRLNRCVFLLKDFEGRIKGGVGRNLSSPASPKWHVYTRLTSCPFMVIGRGGQSIIVEDAISACRANSISDSIALLGTSIPEATIQYILKYSKIYIALDPDATAKSLILQKKLQPYVDTRVLVLKKDIKYFSDIELQELKNNLK